MCGLEGGMEGKGAEVCGMVCLNGECDKCVIFCISRGMVTIFIILFLASLHLSYHMVPSVLLLFCISFFYTLFLLLALFLPPIISLHTLNSVRFLNLLLFFCI